MKTATIAGIVLIILGIFGLLFKTITYTKKEKVVDLGPLEVTSDKKETIPIPTILGGVALVGGIILVVVGSKSKKGS
ncbi:MAG: DUF3185 domain-containing protein [Ignavibacteriaceae bacterium]